MEFHGTKSKLFIIYVVMDVRVGNSRFLCVSIFSTIKTLKIKKKMETIIPKKSVFGKKKILTHKNLKIATLRSITT